MFIIYKMDEKTGLMKPIAQTYFIPSEKSLRKFGKGRYFINYVGGGRFTNIVRAKWRSKTVIVE
ncbi:MAG: hypothetical protein QXG39_00230 [Candidatus Aenigmatarchaeota archaeon]